MKLQSALLSPKPPLGVDNKTRIEPRLRSSINWNLLAQDVNAHALGVLVYQRLKDLDLVGWLPKTIAKAWEADALHARLQFALQRQDALNISHDFNSLGIRHVFLKGFAYREWLYHPSWSRLAGDSDLLIDHHNVESARQAMLNLGFVQASSTIDYRSFLQATQQQLYDTESHHYELGQFVKAYRLMNLPPGIWSKDFVRKVPYTFEKLGDDVVFHSVVDIHWALHFAFASEVPLNSLILARTDDGHEFPRLGLEWSLFTTCFKLYFEAFDRVRYGYHHIVDIIALLKESPTAAQWEHFTELIQRYGLEAVAFYTLSAAESLADQVLVPPKLMNLWADLTDPYWAKNAGPPDIGPLRQELDYGDFFPYLIGRRVPARPLISSTQRHRARH